MSGGRFREFYYWDSYWIIKGLLLSEMRSTAMGMISNFLEIVDRFGFIPNGGRIYYLMRYLLHIILSLFDLFGITETVFIPSSWQQKFIKSKTMLIVFKGFQTCASDKNFHE